MERLTLVIPAKNESESLPNVLDELKALNLNFKIIVVIPKNDELTKKSIEGFNCKVVEEQNGKGYGNALRTGIDKVETDFFAYLMQMVLLTQFT
jgi:glycosyltransferase involved in cell wall biosynthesis